MYSYSRSLLFLSLGLFASASSVAAEGVSIETLLQEMTDREQLARFPQPQYACLQASSYDRASHSPEDPATWFNNKDRSQFIRTETRQGREEHVLMDAQGPGAIVRFWATWRGLPGRAFSNGTLRIYLDGEDEPAIEGPIQEVLDGGLLAGPPLSQSVAESCEYAKRGHNLYLPIPYRQHCKVTYSTDAFMDRGAYKGEALYYQINYRSYEPGTNVESFSMKALSRAEPILAVVQSELADASRPEVHELQSQSWHGTLAPGDTRQVASLSGPAAIRCLRVKLRAANLPQALRSTIIQMSFDDRQTVWAPVGDFFGTGYKIRPYESWYTGVDADREMACWWVMPFEETAKVSLQNVGEQQVDVVSCEISRADWQWDQRSMHFNSTWRQLTNVDTRTNAEAGDIGAFDVTFVTVDGQGVYVGDTLTLFNGAAAWWGEGDEKIYVDRESFPSHFGTGTEDYYGYAWCRPEFFAAPFHTQPEGGGNKAGGFSINSRYRALDAIPFNEQIKFDMELWHWNETWMNYAPTTFFYTRPGAIVNIEPDPETAKLPVVLRRDRIEAANRVEGALEGEELKVVNVTGGKVDGQFKERFKWSGGGQLWWVDGHPGDTLELAFSANTSGMYRVVACLTKASDYATIQISVNGEPAGASELDRYHTRVAHDEVDLGEFHLNKADNRLRLEITGANDKAKKSYMVGLDYLKLETPD